MHPFSFESLVSELRISFAKMEEADELIQQILKLPEHFDRFTNLHEGKLAYIKAKVRLLLEEVKFPCAQSRRLQKKICKVVEMLEIEIFQVLEVWSSCQ